MILNNNELKEVKGGAFSFVIAAIVGIIITFAIGVFDGFTNPIKCRI